MATQKTSSEDQAAIEVRDHCLRYFVELKDFISGSRTDLPDLQRLCDLPPSRSILKASPGEDDRGAYVAVLFSHRDVENERRFDPWWFVIMRWLELSGIHFRLNKSETSGKIFLYVTCMPSNFSLRRLIVNTPQSRATPEKANHYDYRRATLKTEAAKPFIARTKFKMNEPYRQRDKFLESTVSKHLKQQLGLKRNIPNLDISRSSYIRSLGEMFAAADEAFNKLHPNNSE
ncbi:hypothetical protein JJB98_05990 [Bradyrhizobium diazoefficiens]|nr:hypothetical protein [Bradyrhizobium diazoefficiens]QQO19481.1 hypothetical protein JJB98_05990 [Bradyrhizobium diazoefficiens]